MNPMIMTVNEAKYYRDAQKIIADKIINTVKNYFKENAEILASGLMGSSSTFFRSHSGK